MKTFRILLMSFAVIIAISGAIASGFNTDVQSITGWAHNPNLGSTCQSASNLNNNCSVSNPGPDCTISFSGGDSTPQSAYDSEAHCSGSSASFVLKLPM